MRLGNSASTSKCKCVYMVVIESYIYYIYKYIYIYILCVLRVCMPEDNNEARQEYEDLKVQGAYI